MAAQPQERVRKRLVWFSLFLFFVALSPALLGLTCQRTGDTHLALLEIEVLSVNRIVDFDPMVRVYDVWLPEGATTATVRALPMDGVARVNWYAPNGDGTIEAGAIGVGGGEVTIDLPPDGESITVGVFPSGGATNGYVVYINPACTAGVPCSDGNECTADFCNPSTEQCVLTPVADDTACDFGGLPGLCIAGVCEEDDSCPVLTRLTVTPLQADVGDEINLSSIASDAQGDIIDYLWSGSGGFFADPTAASTTYTCLEIGQHDINIAVSDDGFTNCIAGWTVTVECLPMCTEDINCDDGNECTADVCDPVGGTCSNPAEADGTTCDAAGLPGQCAGGSCVESSGNICPNLNVINAIPSTIQAPNNSTLVQTRAQETDGSPMPVLLTLSALWGSFENTENIPMPGNVVGQNATYVCDRPGPVEICVDATDGLCVKTLCTTVTCP